MEDIIKRAKSEVKSFELLSDTTSKELIKEVERLRFLVTASRHQLFKKKLITFEEVISWNV